MMTRRKKSEMMMMMIRVTEDSNGPDGLSAFHPEGF